MPTTNRTFQQDAADVAALAHQCIGNPARRAADEHRKELIRCCMRATHAGDTAAKAAAQKALDDYMPEYRRIMGR